MTEKLKKISINLPYIIDADGNSECVLHQSETEKTLFFHIYF